MKKLNKLVAILVALAMMAMVCVVSAFAATTDVSTNGHAYITKELKIPQGLTNQATFTFNFTPKTVDGNAYVAADEDAGTPANMPAIASVSTQNMTTDADADGSIIRVVDADLTNIVWPHAGTYVYEVTEATPTSSDSRVTITPDGAKYLLTIRVKNATAPATGTVIDTIQGQVENSDGSAGAKVDVTEPTDPDDPDPDNPNPNADEDDGENTFKFVNTETKIADDTDTDDPDPEDPTNPDKHDQASFVIGKTVTGDYGDKNKQFKYTMTIDYSKTYVTNPTITVTKDGTAVDYNAETGVYSFSLADGEEVRVDGAPVGTLYTVTENLANDDNAAKKYTAAVEVSEDGAVSPTTGENAKSVAMPAQRDEAKEGKDLTVTKALVGDAASYAEYTNRNFNDEQTPTGILISNLPYIALALVAIGGLVAYVVIRRRDENA